MTKRLFAAAVLGLALAGCSDKQGPPPNVEKALESATRYQQAVAAYNSKDWAAAVDGFKVALDAGVLREDDQAEGYKQMGVALLELNRASEAVEALNKAIKLEKSLELYELRAKARKANNDAEGYTKDMDRAKAMRSGGAAPAATGGAGDQQR